MSHCETLTIVKFGPLNATFDPPNDDFTHTLIPTRQDFKNKFIMYISIYVC